MPCLRWAARALNVRRELAGQGLDEPTERGLVSALRGDELVLSVAPTFLGGGKRLFDGIDRSAVGLEILEALGSPKVTQLRYAVKKKR